MSDGVLTLLALASAVAGMAAFALANDVHWRQLLGARPRSAATRIACKSVGAVFVGLSFALCVMTNPLTMAILVWPMLLGVAAALVAALVTVSTGRQRRTSK